MKSRTIEAPSTKASDEVTASRSSDAAALWVTYINIVLYALCYQLQNPVEPFLIQSLSEKAGSGDVGGDRDANLQRTYGNLQSFFSMIQTIGSPLVGILLDRIGLRYASAMVFLASATSYGILASAKDMNWLFWSKVPTALQHAFLIAQATAATATGNDAAARAAALGRMTTSYTIGATLGPALGGYLADRGDLYVGAKLAVVGSIISVLLSLLFLPKGGNASASIGNDKKDESNASTAASESKLSRKRSFVDDLRHSGELAVRSSLWPLLFVKVMGGVASSMHSSTLPLVAIQSLDFDPSQLGLSTSIVMFSVAAFGAVGMAPLTKWLGPPGMARWGLLARAMLGLAMAALVSSASYASTRSVLFVQVVGISVFHGLSSHVLATGLTTQTTGAVQPNEQGALLGLEHSLFALARIAGPWLGTTLLRRGGMWMVETACGILDVALVASLIATAAQIGSSKSKDS